MHYLSVKMLSYAYFWSFFSRSLFGKSGGQTIKRIIEDDEMPSASASLSSASRQMVICLN